MTSSTTSTLPDDDHDESVVRLAALFARRSAEKRWTWGDLARIALAERADQTDRLRTLAENLGYGSSVLDGGRYAEGFTAGAGYASDEIYAIVGGAPEDPEHTPNGSVILAPADVDRFRAALRSTDRDSLSATEVIGAVLTELAERPEPPVNTHALRLFVDGVRVAPAGWVMARTPEVAWEILTTHDVAEISFGGGEVSRTTVKWLHENGTAWPGVVHVHGPENESRAALIEKIQAYDTVVVRP